MYHTGPRKGAFCIVQYVTLMLDVCQVCHCVGRCVKIVTHGMKVNGQCRLDILLSQQMLDAIDVSFVTIFVFEQDITHRCILRSAQSVLYTAKLLTFFLLIWSRNGAQLNSTDYEMHMDSCSSSSIDSIN